MLSEARTVDYLPSIIHWFSTSFWRTKYIYLIAKWTTS